MSQTSRNSKIEEEVQKELAPLEQGRVGKLMSDLMLLVFVGACLVVMIVTIKELLF